MNHNFAFENKMRLIGYYNHPNQKINKEGEFPENAEFLAKLLKKSLDSLRKNELTDPIFKSILNSNAVFILKDEENNLYAYSPSTNIARISNVVYNKKAVVPIPFEYKKWFTPGDKIEYNSHQERYHITAPGTDFIIRDYQNRKSLPLKWDEDVHISFKELSLIINDEWITLNEYNTEDDCDGCDGYDYSNCDDDRCDGECEGCGGRRYICNRFCFSKRYKKAYKHSLNNDLVNKELTDLLGILELVAIPHTEHHALFYQYQIKLEDTYERCKKIMKYCDVPSIIESFISKMDYCTELHKNRHNLNDNNCTIIYVNDVKVRCVKRGCIKLTSSGIWIFKSYYIKTSEATYDSISDSITDFDYEFFEFKYDFFERKLKKEIDKISAIYIKNKVITKLSY